MKNVFQKVLYKKKQYMYLYVVSVLLTQIQLSAVFRQKIFNKKLDKLVVIQKYLIIINKCWINLLYYPQSLITNRKNQINIHNINNIFQLNCICMQYLYYSPEYSYQQIFYLKTFNKCWINLYIIHKSSNTQSKCRISIYTI